MRNGLLKRETIVWELEWACQTSQQEMVKFQNGILTFYYKKTPINVNSSCGTIPAHKAKN